MLALIDADIVCHRVGFTTENESVEIAKFRCDDMLDGILYDTGANEFQCWLSDTKENNFRTALSPLYKANRVKDKPHHHEALKEHLILRWGARIAHGMEADDALGIHQTGDSVICSIDKDLMQIPGNHYNFVKKEHSFVNPEEAVKAFYLQILVGDSSDNVDGCRGIGPVKAAKALSKAVEEYDLLQEVYQTYLRQEKDQTEEQVLQKILLGGRLLKIKQKEEEQLWSFPLSAAIMEWFA